MTNNQVTSRELVDYYQRMHGNDTRLKSFIEWNKDAFNQSDAADKDRNAGHTGTLVRGIPVLLKDNIATKDGLNTTSGSYALLRSVVPRFRDLNAPRGWSARGGQGKNPSNLEAFVCGSSSGPAIGVAANLVTVALGSETDGSILCPASANSVVGFKPTVGLTSRDGVIPISSRQDTVGPITRTVADAVHVLDIIAGTDPRDSATQNASVHKPANGYKQHLIVGGLSGKRLGILRTSPFFNLTGPYDAEYNQTYENHFKTIKGKGGVLVDNLVIPNMNTILNFILSGEKLALLAEFKIALNAYLGNLTSSPVKSLLDVINFNKNSTNENIDKIGQGLLLEAQSTNGLNSTVNEAISNLTKLSTQGFEKVMTDNKLDALLIPGIVETSYSFLSIGGYPAITIPAGYDSDNWPFGLVFGGLKYTENKLIEVAYGFEQATLARRAPNVSALLIRKVTDV
ncbi:Amidase family protein [Quillaja saponaria]|uniref:Amidase family protein n=1 Tax=Quillaja saponaria TaxID=32244 RepID=A0AAD7QIT0_QUISA|nr:Amidase family protein [Quillaja saponaria]